MDGQSIFSVDDWLLNHQFCVLTGSFVLNTFVASELVAFGTFLIEFYSDTSSFL